MQFLTNYTDTGEGALVLCHAPIEFNAFPKKTLPFSVNNHRMTASLNREAVSVYTHSKRTFFNNHNQVLLRIDLMGGNVPQNLNLLSYSKSENPNPCNEFTAFNMVIKRTSNASLGALSKGETTCTNRSKKIGSA